VINSKKDIDKSSARQGSGAITGEPNKIGGSTPFDFEAKNLTAYGGLLPVAVLLEKLGFQQLVEDTLTVKRATRAMPMYQFVLAMVLAIYVGFSRLHHLRFVSQEPMLTGILKVFRLPPQCTFWRFLASLHLGVATQLLTVQRHMRERVWEAAHVGLTTVTLDTDTTVHTLFGNQMGGRKSYNPKNKGKKSYQPILTFLAETREYVGGELRNGDRPSGAQIARHLQQVFAGLPPQVTTIHARADSGFYCWDAVEAYEKHGVEFIISARKTPRLVDELKAADWKPSPRTDADGQCQFLISQRDGKGRTGLSLCAIKRNGSRRQPTKPSNTNCSRRRNIATACL
jgi:Transposase DDE domain group 1